MGNEMEREQYRHQHLNNQKKYQVIQLDRKEEQKQRLSNEGHCSNEGRRGQERKNIFQRVAGNSGRTEGSNSKHKKYLSLTKQVGGNSQLVVSKNSSKEKKGIKLTPSQNHLKYSISQVINYNDPLSNIKESNLIKKSIIKPRDLPRHSSQTTIPITPFKIRSNFEIGLSQQNIRWKQPQGQTKSRLTIPYGNQPQISINYAVPNNTRPQTGSTHVISPQQVHIPPSRHLRVYDNWMNNAKTEEIEKKRLKKVPLTRSFEVQSNSTATSKSIPSQNQEQSMFVKEVSDLTKLRHNFTQQEKSKILELEVKEENKENQKSLGDQFTTQKNIQKDFKETESKYAVAYQQNGVYIQHMLKHKPLSQSITKESARSIANKYSVAIDRWMAQKGNCDELQEKVERQVISHPVIEEPFIFPTATDISEDQRSDNTSFLPIQKHQHNDSRSYIQLQGEDLLQYCKPNINAKVLADMLKLPLKS